MAVAEVKEGVILIHIAAPTPDGVTADVLQHGKGRRQPLRIPAVEGIQRYPVGAHDKDRPVVDEEAELAGAVGGHQGGAIQLHRPDAQVQRPAVHRDTGPEERHRHLIQARLSGVPRVPQPGIRDGDVQVAGGVPHILPGREAVVAVLPLNRYFIVQHQLLIHPEGVVQVQLRKAPGRVLICRRILREPHAPGVQEHLLQPGQGIRRL